MGRPRGTDKLTPEVQAQIIELLEQGNFASVAARASGISPATFNRWMQQGQEQKKGRFRAFRDAVTRARGVAQAKYVELLRDAAKTDWRAAAFYLERTDPERWGARRYVEQHSTSINRHVMSVGTDSAAAYGRMLREAYRALQESRIAFPDVPETIRLHDVAGHFGVLGSELEKLDAQSLDAEVLLLSANDGNEQHT